MSKLIPYEIQILECKPVVTTAMDYDEDEFIPLNYVDCFLYHGIRFQKHLEVLEKIFKTRKILAGKYIENYYPYSDNCNLGEYVSLLKWIGIDSLEYETFIMSNISLIVSPLCGAIETKRISFDLWEEIQQSNWNLKQIYSYMNGECLCKDFIPIEMIKAIGVPYQRLKSRNQSEDVDLLINDIIKLMEQYDISLPIVDTSRYNQIIIENNNILNK